MAALTQSYINPRAGATDGNDHGGNAFVDGSFANATLTLTKIGAFTAATCQAGDKLYLDDNGSGQVTPGLYTISVRTDNDNVVLTADIRSGAPDPVDVRCDQHTGAVGLPWATTQHCADFTTQAASGDQWNLRDTAADVLAGSLDLTTYGNPTGAAPLVIRGYTTAADDGGIGELDGNNAASIFDDNGESYISFVDLEMHNCGAAHIVRADDYINIINCELHNTSGYGCIIDDNCKVMHSNFHDIGSFGVYGGEATLIMFNTFENGTKTFTTTISTSVVAMIAFNILVLSGVSDGIAPLGYGVTIVNNSIYAAGAATGQGIVGGVRINTVIMNNLIEGFSGVGGVGIETSANSRIIYGYNQVYDCATEYSIGGDIVVDLGNNETLIASPFTNAGGGDFTPIPGILAEGWPDDFSGVNTDNFLDPGAAQAEAGGGDVVGWW